MIIEKHHLEDHLKSGLNTHKEVSKDFANNDQFFPLYGTGRDFQ